MADLDSGNRDYPSLYRLYMRCTRVPNRMFLHTFGTVVDNRSKIGLVRAIYTPDELNQPYMG